MCDKHLAKHSRTSGPHAAESLLIKLSPSQRNDMSLKITNLAKDIKTFEANILESARILIECISKEVENALKNTEELAIVHDAFLLDKKIDKETYERIVNIRCNATPMWFEKINTVRDQISNLFSQFKLESWKEGEDIKQDSYIQSILRSRSKDQLNYYVNDFQVASNQMEIKTESLDYNLIKIDIWKEKAMELGERIKEYDTKYDNLEAKKNQEVEELLWKNERLSNILGIIAEGIEKMLATVDVICLRPRKHKENEEIGSKFKRFKKGIDKMIDIFDKQNREMFELTMKIEDIENMCNRLKIDLVERSDDNDILINIIDDVLVSMKKNGKSSVRINRIQNQDHKKKILELLKKFGVPYTS